MVSSCDIFPKGEADVEKVGDTDEMGSCQQMLLQQLVENGLGV